MAENIIRPSQVSPDFIKKLEKEYGPVDMERDFFSDNLSIYYKSDEGDPKNHRVIKLASFEEAFVQLSKALDSLIETSRHKEGEKDPKIDEIANEVRETFNKFRTHLRKNYPEQYDIMKQQLGNLDETSNTGGSPSSASFTSGGGMQHSSTSVKAPKSYYKLGYKLVPKKVPNSGLEVNQLFEEGEETAAKKFQKRRIEAFDLIEKQLNDLYKILDSKKTETIEYYNTNPETYAIVVPTDLVLDYIKDIYRLLNNDEG